jgi:hypothetical protein
MSKQTRAAAESSPEHGRTAKGRGRRPRRTAICCACGALRTIAVNASPRRPAGAPDMPESWWLTWLRCSGPCKAITPHALINDAGPESSPRDGREEDNRRTDTARRVLQRRLAGLNAEGVEIEWVTAEDLEQPAEFPAEVKCRRFGPTSRFTIVLLSDADPADLLAAVEEAERLLDKPGDPCTNSESAYLLPGRRRPPSAPSAGP